MVAGRLYHCYAAGAQQFADISRALLLMDELYESLGLPQATQAMRSFGRSERKAAPALPPLPPLLMEARLVREQRGELATFIVRLRQRQNVSWQGQVLWQERGVSRNFRSALELLKLIDGCVYQISNQ